MKTCEFTGKTTQEAIDHGLSELGVTIADVRVEVLQEGAKGLFGRFGSKPAKVRITVFEEEKEEDGGLSDLLGSFSLDSNTKKQKAKPQPKAAAPKKTEKSRKRRFRKVRLYRSRWRLRGRRNRKRQPSRLRQCRPRQRRR